MDAQTLQGLLTSVSDYSAVRYTNVAFLALLIYDHILTFSDEVSKIWTLPWRPPKISFLINRYLVPPMLLFDGLTPSMHLGKNVCNFIGDWTSWPTVLSIGTVDVILILRVSAIYGRCKRVTHCLIAFFLCTLGAWIILDVMITKGTSSMPGGEVFTGCLFMAPDYFYAAWIPPVVFETVIIVLTVYKISQADSMTPTLTILARDSIVYFTMIFVMLLSNLFLARFGKGFQGALLIEPCSVVACIAVARMTLNIRDSKQTIPLVSGGPRTTELHFEADVSELTVGTNLSSV
ncbi:hypothetical protein E4T56_gene16433 [Termitomyces sp. T112]|nr:hypothetical protein E4T56_gene16433 [Termitomyces sp. T112]